jgi:hypothetical protein
VLRPSATNGVDDPGQHFAMDQSLTAKPIDATKRINYSPDAPLRMAK